jgi:hypothetical protein
MAFPSLGWPSGDHSAETLTDTQTDGPEGGSPRMRLTALGRTELLRSIHLGTPNTCVAL